MQINRFNPLMSVLGLLLTIKVSVFGARPILAASGGQDARAPACPLKTVAWFLGAVWLFGLANPAFAAGKVVGTVSFAKGSVAAQQKGSAAPRILGKGAEVFQGDNIQTAERSFVIVEFVDGAKVTVRPNSSFSIDQYQNDAAKPEAKLSLYQGGVRAESGAIAAQGPDNFEIKTATTTVKAEQADYSVRVCESDCDEQASAQGQGVAGVAADKSGAVARIADIKGEVLAKSQKGERELALGGPLFNEDQVSAKANSYALMVFLDGEKITLQENSKMDIASYHFNEDGKADSALHRLLSGGMRVLTGAIGKTNKAAFAVDTPVGTIGVRGTGFDVSCVGSCVGAAGGKSAAPGQDGLYSYVWQGQIAVVNDAGEFVLTMPESKFIANRTSPAIDLPGIPDMLFKNPFPRPDLDRSNLNGLLEVMRTRGGVPKGVYVDVHKGKVQLEKNAGISRAKTTLEKNQAVRVDAKATPVRLAQAERLQQKDPYLTPDDDKKKSRNQGIYSRLAEGDETDGDKGNFQCGE